MFSLGSFSIDEIIYGVAESFQGELLYSLDQLSDASIEISSESSEVTDKRGNVIRTIYKSKTGTFNATNALLHPQIMNAASGSAIERATADNTIVMPKIQVIAAGATVALDATVDANTISVIGLFGSGANSDALTLGSGSSASFSGNTGTYLYNTSDKEITLPAGGTDKPVSYLVKYDRTVADGIKLSNSANSFPDTVKLSLYCSYVDPCDGTLKACYVVLPSFQASPETTISLNADETEMDFSGNLQLDYCSADKALYYIYFPSENAVKTAIVA